jgi:hypothetical protein
MQYGVLAGLLGGLACAGNSARTDETTVAQDTTIPQDTSAYRAMSRDTTSRDTSWVGASDSAKVGQTKSGPSEIKPGESTIGTDSTAKSDTLRTGNDTTAQ